VPHSDYDYEVSPDPLADHVSWGPAPGSPHCSREVADHVFWGPAPGSPHCSREDPMSLEASYLDAAPAAALHLAADLHYYPDDAGERPLSPAYVPVSALWASSKQAPDVSTAQTKVLFGPGVQLQPTGEDEVGDIFDLVNKMDIDPAVEDGLDHAVVGDGPETAGSPDQAVVAVGSPLRASPPEGGLHDDPYAGLFCKLPPPVLQTPQMTATTSSVPMPRARRSRKQLASTRSSTRLASRGSSVPVAERAQRKLMRELNFINNQQHTPDDAVAEYLDLYVEDLPAKAIKAIQSATRLGNKKLAKILEAIVQEADTLELEA